MLDLPNDIVAREETLERLVKPREACREVRIDMYEADLRRSEISTPSDIPRLRGVYPVLRFLARRRSHSPEG